MKKVIAFLLFLLQFIVISTVLAQTPAVTSGLSYLASTQNPDGSWTGMVNRGTLPTTVITIEALSALGQGNSQNYTKAVSWLQVQQTQDMTTSDYLAERIHALSVSGTDADLLVSHLDDMTGAWGGDGSPDVDILDTALALQALRAVNYSDQNVISSTLYYLTSTQNPNGGWGFYQGDDSNVYMTASVLNALSQFKAIYNLQTPINNAVAYLLTKQNADGGFGSGGASPAPTSTVFETALSFEALIASGAVGADKAANIQNAINYISSTQLPNGSWNDDPYSTALALRALANVKPNLSISSSDITFSTPAPTAGETITITATIKNTGSAQAPSAGSGYISVHFYDGDPNAGGTLIGETTIPTIPASGSSIAAINWTIPTASSKIIFVQIDPLNVIDELNETDNIASKNLTSATLPDLSITSGDITFSPSAPMPNDPVTITATVRNKGETNADNITVEIYDGDPSSGGILIGSATIPSIGAGSSAATQLAANLTAGSHNIHVIADKADFITESNETNNKAMKTLQVGGGFIDLSITSSDITFSPANPVEGDTVTINALIHNEGEAAAGNVLVRFYLGDPDAGGSQIGSDINISSISARGIATTGATWDSTGKKGNNEIYVKVDPLNTISEITELNNKASKTIKIAAKTGPDLTLTSADINFIPLTPNTGDTVTITANIRNIGTSDANNVFVEFSLGDPNVGGTLIFGSQIVPFIAQGSSAIVQATWNTTGFSGTYEIYVNADPFNEIPELNETNNIAHATLEIKSPQGPDLTIRSIDTTNLITDTQALKVSGSIKATIENKGNQATNTAFEITVFEDRDKNKTIDPAIDNIFGKLTYTNNLAANATDIIEIPISGSILFRDNPIHVTADSGNAVSELDETDNTKNTGRQCEYRPPVGTFNPVEKWRWTGSSVLPTYNQVISTPIAANLTDDNGDGLINEKDIPDIIFIAGQPCDWVGYTPGVLRAISGDDGRELFTVTNLNYRLVYISTLAVGDMDNDGIVEIIGSKAGGGTIAFEHDGTLKWISPYGDALWGGISIADIDTDGSPEIIIGATVLNNDGTLRWNGTGGRGSNYGAISLVADVDLDGLPEIVAGNTVYKNNGTILWRNISVGDGFNAIANFDDDPYPEIVLVTLGNVYLLKYNGTKIWGPVAIPGGVRGGAPTVADFDGDGKPEIGVAGVSRYVVFKSDGSILWQSVIQDGSSLTGSSVFDFDGDGQAEVVYNDERSLRIYRGSNGHVLFSTPNSSGTGVEYPIIVDVDNDNRAEIIVSANDCYSYTPRTHRGIRVFEDANDNWVNTRKIWNQHTYHITNINDDGTIPRREQNNWEIYNNYRCDSLLPEEVLGSSDITVSYITVDRTNYPASVTISARVGNGGAVSQVAGVDIAFYDGDPDQGGILIATAKTSRVIEAGDYEDIAVIWNNPGSGNHTVFIAADRDNRFNECREDNNITSASLNIGGVQPPGQNLPDLSISSSDVTIIPPGTIEGQPAVIKAIMHNIGTVMAPDVVISFYDGDPQSGGLLIGSVTKSYIDAGANAFAEITWDTFGQSGRNYIHVIIDPQNLIVESNENNNSTLIPVDVAPPSKPDLAITSSDIAFSSLNPKEGEPLTIDAAIHNLGSDVVGVEVYLYDGDPASGGILLLQKTIPQTIPFGGKTTASFAINTFGLAGTHNFHISIDPNNKISETNETNNIAWSPLTVGSSGIALSVVTNKTLYPANENVQITVNIKNLINSNCSGTLEVKIIDPNNNLVSAVGSQALALSPNENKILNYTWNTAQTLSGNYKVYSHFIEGGNATAKADTPITITPVKAVSSKVTTDKISYKANETVAIISQIQSTSPNYIFENLTARITITNIQGTGLYTDTRNISILTPGQLTELKTYWNTFSNPKGTYIVKLEVLEGATILSTSTATFEILSSGDTGEGLSGTITASPNPVYMGKDETIIYSVINNGNEDMNNLNVKVLIVNPDTQEIKNTFESTVNLPINTTAAGNLVSSTSNLTPRTYLAILQAKTASMPEYKTLASTTFEVKPAIEITKAIPDVKNILVWLNYPWQSGQNIPDRSLIEKALKEAGVTYHIVLDKKDFETELRNQYYTDFMILGDHSPMEDHFSEELREQIYSGKGLISSLFNRQNLDSDVFGIKFNGSLSGKDYPVELAESEIATAQTFQSYGRALKVEAINPAETIGWIPETTNKGTTRHPGIVKREYGNGNVLFYAFDLGMSSADYNQFASLFKNSLNYIHKPLDATGFHPNQLIPVEIRIKSMGGAFDLKITETYPSEIKMYDPSTEKWITDNPWTTNLQLAANETRAILYYALTPDKAGIYILKTEMGYMENGTYNFYQTLSTDIVVNKDTVTAASDIITALRALSVSGQDKAKVDNAIRYITDVQGRAITTEQDIEKNVHDILKAIDFLISVTGVDISNIRLIMDEFLMAWEGRWYSIGA